ncbi:T9SS type A sorting domain-containing protein [Winogradskyella sediminis]|uniref:Delta-60 repeat domain-containing protein/Por secretion system C-terminal sorting domain-containing protein n=1 Tax=Winogradskyella sediminis TaxID=1382466 RepID=A0A1H1XK43_9FLAO|nr:T9SS type A sorting domain-containing protein [Winogradskyella sediminis]SDT09552.1 delta-60 repeat domain-containing protein/Por secretion system C-terminal sorting domain-containing protein [Winogradskyella sediminis]
MIKNLQLIFLLLVSPICLSQSFELDLSFGNSGNSGYFAIDDGSEYFKKVINDGNGLLYYVGYTNNPTRVAVSSTTETGVLNLAFGSDALKTFVVPGSTDNGSSGSTGQYIAFQNDKLIVGAFAEINNTEETSLVVLRLNLDGTLDTTFGTNGYYIYDPVGNNTYFSSMAVNDAGEIFIGGNERVGTTSNYSYLVQKLTVNGVLDTTFATNGRLSFNNFSSGQWISAFCFLDNGQILIYGTENDNQLYLLNADGSFDGTFGTGGNLSTSLPLEIRAIKEVNDYFIAAGNNRNNWQPTILKFNNNGFDTSFGVNGIASSTYTASMQDAFITDQGTAYFASNGSGLHRVFRTETQNSTPFDIGNFDVYEHSFNQTVVYGITPLANGSIVAAGIGSDLINSGSGTDMMAFKLDATSLSVDDSFLSLIKTYPNPVQDILYFNDYMTGEITISSLNGQQVLKQRLDETLSIDISHFKKGIYVIKLKTITGPTVLKLVKA